MPPQVKEAVHAWVAGAQRPIDSRKVLSGVDGFETFETKEPAVHARAADSQQRKSRGAWWNVAAAFNQREGPAGGTLPYSWSQIRAGQVLARHYVYENN